jgi:hypothetical protein
MRAAPAHLEAKLRFWDLSVGQIAAAFAGVMLGVAWAKFLSPLPGMWGAMSGAYIAALPVIPVFVASQTELDLGDLVVGAVRWRRLEGRYLPGAGETAHGYLLIEERTDAGVRDDAEVLQPWLGALWDGAPATMSAPTGTPVPAAAPTGRDSANDRGPDHEDRHRWHHRNGREEQ